MAGRHKGEAGAARVRDPGLIHRRQRLAQRRAHSFQFLSAHLAYHRHLVDIAAMRRQQIQAGAGVRERAVREAGVEGAEGARGRPVLEGQQTLDRRRAQLVAQIEQFQLRAQLTEQRANDLLDRLTLNETIAQLSPTAKPFCAIHTPALARVGLWLTALLALTHYWRFVVDRERKGASPVLETRPAEATGTSR